MDNWANAAVRAVLEALTEFLPVSSTGHLFLFSFFFPFQPVGRDPLGFEDLYDIFIQTGAIASVVFLYRKKFLQEFRSVLAMAFYGAKETQGRDFFRNIAVGVAPILFFGFAFKSHLDSIKANQYLLGILGTTWIVGGLVMILVENLTHSPKPLHTKMAIWIGLIQVLALLPGVSRSAATIIAGRLQGLSKTDAAEFSFFLAVPVLTLAGIYKLFKYKSLLTGEALQLLFLGSILSFVLCIFVIRLFLAFLKKQSFVAFGIYRIVIGIAVLLYFFLSK